MPYYFPINLKSTFDLCMISIFHRSSQISLDEVKFVDLRTKVEWQYFSFYNVLSYPIIGLKGKNSTNHFFTHFKRTAEIYLQL